MADATSVRGPLLRRIAGVNETLLDEVPSDRFRYSRLGGIIVGTASIATLSMWFGLGEVLGETSFLLVLPAMIWGLFIGNLDAWIVSTLHGTRWRSHAWVVLPRIVMAIIFGVLIAEPLVLRAFAPAIEREIKDSREAELLALQTRLVTCNPVNGTPSLGVDCSGSRVVVNLASPQALALQIGELDAQEHALEHSITHDNNHQSTLEETARLECNGTPGKGLSGKFGDGVNCKTDRLGARKFQSSSHVGEQTAQLLALRQQVDRLAPQRRTRAQEYEKAIAAAIAAKVSQQRSHQGRIGLLERLYALRTLVAKNWYLGVAEWFLRLFFITVDCLPVIVKVSGGSSAYDQLLEQRRTRIEHTHAAREKDIEREATSASDIVQYRLERKVQAEMEQIDSELRLETARRNLEVDAAIDEFTDRLLREQRAGTAAVRRRFFENAPQPAGKTFADD